MRKLVIVLCFCFITSIGWALPDNVKSSHQKYSMVQYEAKKTIEKDNNANEVAKMIAPSNMPQQDVELLAQQIKKMNPKKNKGTYNEPLLVFNGTILGKGMMLDGLTYVPLRPILEMTGYVVGWHEGIIYCSKPHIKPLKIHIAETKDAPLVVINGSNFVIGILSGNTTYVPLRKVLDIMNFIIHWEGEPNYRVKLGSPNSDVSWMKDWGQKGWVTGTELVVPIYKNGSRLHQADMRNWHYAVHAGLKWGVHPALLIAIRNHENPSSSRDGFALGVLHVRWQGIWAQYNWGSRIIARVARARGMNPMSPTRSGLAACNRQPGGYAVSQAWSGRVWSNYLRATGK